MRKAEAQGASAVELTAAVALGGLLALGIAMMILFLGAVAVSNGILREDITLQITAASCVLGGLCGGLLACARWKSRRLLAGLAAGGVCFLLILTVSLLMGDGPELGLQALVELAGCLCGGGVAGLFGGGRKGKKRSGSRKK